MSPEIRRFGVDQVGNTRNITHVCTSALGIGLGVSLGGNDLLNLAQGNNLHGVVVQCETLSSQAYLVTVCTLAERIAVRLKDGEDVANGATLSFTNGELVADAQGKFYLQEIDEAYYDNDGKTHRAAHIQLI